MPPRGTHPSPLCPRSCEWPIANPPSLTSYTCISLLNASCFALRHRPPGLRAQVSGRGALRRLRRALLLLRGRPPPDALPGVQGGLVLLGGLCAAGLRVSQGALYGCAWYF